MAEDRVATVIPLGAPGTAAVAFPLLDLGFDFYLRRIRTLRAHPAQVKARSFLEPDGEFQASIASLYPDPNGYVVLPYVPPPDWQLHPKLWAIPIPEFLKLAQPHGAGYLFSGYLDGRFPPSASNRFLIEVNQLLTAHICWLGPAEGLEGTGASGAVNSSIFPVEASSVQRPPSRWIR